MLLLNTIVEQRIAEAMASGTFDDLPGAGRPLDLGDDALVPEELRVAHRILKNAGYLPPEVTARREIADATVLLRLATGDHERRRAALRLALLAANLDAEGRSLPLDYRESVSPKGRPEGKPAPKRVSAKGSPASERLGAGGGAAAGVPRDVSGPAAAAGP